MFLKEQMKVISKFDPIEIYELFPKEKRIEILVKRTDDISLLTPFLDYTVVKIGSFPDSRCLKITVIK